MFQGTQKPQLYFSRDYGFEVTVKMCENQYFTYIYFNLNQQPLELGKF